VNPEIGMILLIAPMCICWLVLMVLTAVHLWREL
jgi:hypothetical protein